MLILKKELMLCLTARGYDDVPGFEDAAAPLTQAEQVGVRERLLHHNLLETAEEENSGYRFSAFGQVILDTVGKPDAWLEIRNSMTPVHRRIYIRDAFYVCAEEDKEMLLVSILPSLPLVIGGYASALKGPADNQMPLEEFEPAWESGQKVITLRVCCDGKALIMEVTDNGIVKTTGNGTATFSSFSRETCTNAATMWLLNSLKERGNK